MSGVAERAAQPSLVFSRRAGSTHRPLPCAWLRRGAHVDSDMLGQLLGQWGGPAGRGSGSGGEEGGGAGGSDHKRLLVAGREVTEEQLRSILQVGG